MRRYPRCASPLCKAATVSAADRVKEDEEGAALVETSSGERLSASVACTAPHAQVQTGAGTRPAKLGAHAENLEC